MSATPRSMKRAKQARQKKEAKQRIGKVERLMNEAPKNCTVCGADFDNKNPTHLDSWKVKVFDDRIELYCNSCYHHSRLTQNEKHKEQRTSDVNT